MKSCIAGHLQPSPEVLAQEGLYKICFTPSGCNGWRVSSALRPCLCSRNTLPGRATIKHSRLLCAGCFLNWKHHVACGEDDECGTAIHSPVLPHCSHNRGVCKGVLKWQSYTFLHLRSILCCSSPFTRPCMSRVWIWKKSDNLSWVPMFSRKNGGGELKSPEAFLRP